jgi:hypothetical protein
MSTKTQVAEKWAHSDIRTLDKIVENCAKAKGVEAAKVDLKWVQNDPKLLARALSTDGLLVEDEETGAQRVIRFFPYYKWNATKVSTAVEG